MKNVKFIMTAALLALTSLSLTACDESDIAFGTGVVVGVIIGDSNDHHHHRPNPPRYRGRGWHAAAVDLSKLTPSERVAVKYDLSLEQSAILTSHLLRAQAGDMAALAEIGFEKSDLVALFNGQNPSASTLTQLSQSLNLDMGQAHQLIQNIKADAIKAQDSLM